MVTGITVLGRTCEGKHEASSRVGLCPTEKAEPATLGDSDSETVDEIVRSKPVSPRNGDHLMDAVEEAQRKYNEGLAEDSAQTRHAKEEVGSTQASKAPRRLSRSLAQPPEVPASALESIPREISLAPHRRSSDQDTFSEIFTCERDDMRQSNPSHCETLRSIGGPRSRVSWDRMTLSNASVGLSSFGGAANSEEMSVSSRGISEPELHAFLRQRFVLAAKGSKEARLDTQMQGTRDLMASASLADVLQLSVNAAASKRTVRTFFFVLGFLLVFWFGRAALAFARHSSLHASHLRLTVLDIRGAEPSHALGAVLAEFGALENGCRVQTNATRTDTDRSTTLSFAESVSFDGWFAVTAPGTEVPVELARVDVDWSADGLDFTPLPSAAWHSSLLGGVLHMRPRSVSLPGDPGAQLSVSTGPEWPWLVLLAASFLVPGLGLLASWAAGSVHRWSGGVRGVLCGALALSGVLHVVAGVGMLAVGRPEEGVLPLVDAAVVSTLAAALRWREALFVPLTCGCCFAYSALGLLLLLRFEVGGAFFLQSHRLLPGIFALPLQALFSVSRRRSLRAAEDALAPFRSAFQRAWGSVHLADGAKERLGALSEMSNTANQFVDHRARLHQTTQIGARAASLDQLYAQASGLQLLLRKKVLAWAQSCNGLLRVSSRDSMADSPPEYCRCEDHMQQEALLQGREWVPLKDPQRAMEKVVKVLGGDASQLTDLCRSRIVFERLDDLTACFRAIIADQEVFLERLSNRMEPSYDGTRQHGYREVTLKVRIDSAESARLGANTHIGEVQLVLRAFDELETKDFHRLYLAWKDARELFDLWNWTDQLAALCPFLPPNCRPRPPAHRGPSSAPSSFSVLGSWRAGGVWGNSARAAFREGSARGAYLSRASSHAPPQPSHPSNPTHSGSGASLGASLAASRPVSVNLSAVVAHLQSASRRGSQRTDTASTSAGARDRRGAQLQRFDSQGAPPAPCCPAPAPCGPRDAEADEDGHAGRDVSAEHGVPRTGNGSEGGSEERRYRVFQGMMNKLAASASASAAASGSAASARTSWLTSGHSRGSSGMRSGSRPTSLRVELPGPRWLMGLFSTAPSEAAEEEQVVEVAQSLEERRHAALLSEFLTTVGSPAGQLQQKLTNPNEAMLSASSASVLFTSMPLASALCKAWFRGLLFLLSALFFALAMRDAVFAAHGVAARRRYLRFTALELRHADIEQHPGPHIARMGALLEGCKAQAPASVQVYGHSLELDFGEEGDAASGVEMDGWWFQTEEEADSGLDAVRFEVEGSMDGVEFVPLVPPHLELHSLPPSGSPAEHVFSTPMARGQEVRFDLRLTWKFVVRKVLVPLDGAVTLLVVAACGLLQRQFAGKQALLAGVLVAAWLYGDVAVGELAEGNIRWAIVPAAFAVGHLLLCTLLVLREPLVIQQTLLVGLLALALTILDAALLRRSPHAALDPRGAFPFAAALVSAVGLFFPLYRSQALARSQAAIRKDQEAYGAAWEAVLADPEGRAAIAELQETAEGLRAALSLRREVRQGQRASLSAPPADAFLRRMASAGAAGSEEGSVRSSKRSSLRRSRLSDFLPHSLSLRLATNGDASAPASPDPRSAGTQPPSPPPPLFHSEPRSPIVPRSPLVFQSSRSLRAPSGGGAPRSPIVPRAPPQSPERPWSGGWSLSLSESFRQVLRQGANTSTGVVPRAGSNSNRPGSAMVGSRMSFDPATLSLDALYAQAAVLQVELESKVHGWALQSPGACLPLRPAPTHHTHEMVSGRGGGGSEFASAAEALGDPRLAARVKRTRLKGAERAIEKLVRSYQKEVGRLTDVCRESLVFRTPSALLAALHTIATDPDVRLVRVKNRLDPAYEAKTSAGYRDVALNLQIVTPYTEEAGIEAHVCELQLILIQFAALKSEEGHKRYVEFRNARGE